MIKMLIVTNKATNTIELTLQGHATYGDAPAGDELTYKKVCACVTLITLSIEDYCEKNGIKCELDKGLLHIALKQEEFTQTLQAYVHELFILHNITKGTYTLVETKEL